MRRLVVLSLAAAVLLAIPPAASARSSYCSRSGDLCYGVMRPSGAVVLRIDTFARYFARYRLCVTDPSGRRSCRSFPIRRRGRLYGSSVRWSRNFPQRGPGVYRAAWFAFRSRLGPVLTFRVRGS